MKKLTRVLILTPFLALNVAYGQTGGAAKIENQVAPGNLKSNRDLGCADQTQLSAQDTPADLYSGVAKCIRQGDNPRAMFMFAKAGVYGRFDSLRVADKTAHQAVQVLQMTYIGPLDEQKRDAFRESLQKALIDPKELQSTCDALRRIGPPNYRPEYMIQHGLGAFDNKGSAEPFVPGFDARAAWEQSLSGYLHCPSLK
jgi:hypothetical protein